MCICIHLHTDRQTGRQTDTHTDTHTHTHTSTACTPSECTCCCQKVTGLHICLSVSAQLPSFFLPRVQPCQDNHNPYTNIISQRSNRYVCKLIDVASNNPSNPRYSSGQFPPITDNSLNVYRLKVMHVLLCMVLAV